MKSIQIAHQTIRNQIKTNPISENFLPDPHSVSVFIVIRIYNAN